MQRNRHFGFLQTRRRVYRMKSGINLNVRCGRRIIAGRSFIVIQKSTVSIDFAVVSAVHKKGRRDPSSRRTMGNTILSFYIYQIRLVISPDRSFALWLLRQKLPAGIFSRPVIPPAISIFISIQDAPSSILHTENPGVYYMFPFRHKKTGGRTPLPPLFFHPIRC